MSLDYSMVIIQRGMVERTCSTMQRGKISYDTSENMFTFACESIV